MKKNQAPHILSLRRLILFPFEDVRVALIWVLAEVVVIVIFVVTVGGVVAKLTSSISFVLDDLDDDDDGHVDGEQISAESGRFMSGGRLVAAICLK